MALRELRGDVIELWQFHLQFRVLIRTKWSRTVVRRIASYMDGSVTLIDYFTGTYLRAKAAEQQSRPRIE